MTINRRIFLKSSAASLLAFSSVPISKIAYAQTSLTGAIYFTPTYKAIVGAAHGFAKDVKNSSHGAVNINLYDSGTLVTADEQLPALRAGSIDLMFHATSYMTRSFPILGITALPGIVEKLYKNPDRLMIGSPLFNLINEELGKKNLYMLSLGGGILEPEYIWSVKNKEINSLSQVDGVKMRIASYQATQVLKSYGVAAKRLTSSETYLALQRGIVSAAVANIATVMGRSLYEQLGMCYKLPVTAYTVAPFMLRDRWESLPDEVRKSLKSASAWYDNNLISNSNHVYRNYWTTVQNAGVRIAAPSGQQLENFTEHSKPVWDVWKNSVGERVGNKAIAYALGEA